ncbi:hypothetical protein K461DRAFT_129174 [Myriangium duriaei CBS 260.36]|uniref:C2H2-type domain-containing protein n=1 Tax=Myriangium duriaei CBS 260.36 TaxID=1168546 RepID=A0A9P4J747_9PEZI|nr:hypothetical protein K461DRAFT_129174 [Myriangium duriaei CBS 260.36]
MSTTNVLYQTQGFLHEHQSTPRMTMEYPYPTKATKDKQPAQSLETNASWEQDTPFTETHSNYTLNSSFTGTYPNSWPGDTQFQQHSPQPQYIHHSPQPQYHHHSPQSQYDQHSPQPQRQSSHTPTPEAATRSYRCYQHGCNGRQFSGKGNYMRHLREQDKSNHVQCSFCGTAFSRKSNRDNHIKRGCKFVREFEKWIEESSSASVPAQWQEQLNIQHDMKYSGNMQGPSGPSDPPK